MDRNKDLLAKIKLKEWNFTKSYIIKRLFKRSKNSKIR